MLFKHCLLQSFTSTFCCSLSLSPALANQIMCFVCCTDCQSSMLAFTTTKRVGERWTEGEWCSPRSTSGGPSIVLTQLPNE